MAMMFEDEKSKEAIVQSLGIFELRGLARELGVKSPTTKKRDELIDQIMKIVENGSEGLKSNKRGRPFKKLSSIGEIANSVTTSWLDNIKPTYESVMSFAQTLPDFDKLLDGSMNLSGYAREVDDMISFFDYNNRARVFIKNDTEFASKITNGDCIEVLASPLQERGHYIAEKIIEINGIEAQSYEPYSVNNGDVVIGKTPLNFASHNLILGRRNAMMMKEDLFETEILDELLSSCNQNDINLIVLALNTSYENMIMFNNLKDCKKFVSVSGSDARLNLDLLIDAINCANNCIERGEKALLFVGDIVHSIKSVEDCFGQSGKDIKENTDIILQKVLEIAKAFENNISATCLLGYYDIDLKNDNFVDKVLKISKNCE